MEKILSNELAAKIKEIGELIKLDPRYVEMAEASDRYNNDAELSSLLDKYSEMQSKLSAEYDKTELDPASIKSIQKEMDEIYSSLISNVSFIKLREASDAYEELTGAVYSELEYAVTGKRREECTHDCSTCHGCG